MHILYFYFVGQSTVNSWWYNISIFSFFYQGTSTGSYLCTVSADGSSKITYSIDDTVNFNIGQVDGTIVTNKIFDFENPAEKQFKVKYVKEFYRD